MTFKKCPGCEINDILVQDKICYICHLKIIKDDEIINQQLNRYEKKLFIALKQIIEQFNSYVIFKKRDYAKILLEIKIRHHLDFSNYDEEAFRNDYPLLFKMFPGEFYFWIELKRNFLEALERISVEREREQEKDSRAEVILLNHKLAIEKYDNKKSKESMEDALRKKTEELEEEREIHTEAMKTMNNWYLQRNQELIKENEKKDQKIKELEQQLKSLKSETNQEINCLIQQNKTINIIKDNIKK